MAKNPFDDLEGLPRELLTHAVSGLLVSAELSCDVLEDMAFRHHILVLTMLKTWREKIPTPLRYIWFEYALAAATYFSEIQSLFRSWNKGWVEKIKSEHPDWADLLSRSPDKPTKKEINTLQLIVDDNQKGAYASLGSKIDESKTLIERKLDSYNLQSDDKELFANLFLCVVQATILNERECSDGNKHLPCSMLLDTLQRLCVLSAEQLRNEERSLN